jgi:hypothetical protein
VSIIDRILRRRSHYRAVFHPSASRDAVLADLARFCRADRIPIVLGKDGHTDIYATGIEAGRQEVLKRILAHLDVDDSQLLRMKEEADHE